LPQDNEFQQELNRCETIRRGFVPFDFLERDSRDEWQKFTSSRTYALTLEIPRRILHARKWVGI